MDAKDKLQAANKIGRRLPPIDQFKGSLAIRVYQVLKEAILSLAYQPGEILRKREICETLGVSRSPVSEAVAILASEGLVKVIPKAGTFVSRFSMDEIREGAFLREALELAAIEHVAATITADQLARLYQNLQQQEDLVEQKDFAGFFGKDAEMHDLILSFTGYRRLRQLAESSWVQVNRARHFNLPSPGRIQETVIEHRRILDALASGDPVTARKATRDHLRQLIKYLEPLERQKPELFDIRKSEPDHEDQ